MNEIEITILRLLTVAPKVIDAVTLYVEALHNKTEERLWDEWLINCMNESDHESFLLNFADDPKYYIPTFDFLQKSRHSMLYADDLNVLQLAVSLVIWRKAGRPEGYYDREIGPGLTYRTSIGEDIVTFYLGGA